LLIENGDIIRKSVLPEGVERIVAEKRILQQGTEELASEATNFVHESNIDERLIEEVRKREPLYNYQLPLAQRGRKQTKQMWQDISIELNGNVLYYLLYNQFIFIIFEMDIYKFFAFQEK